MMIIETKHKYSKEKEYIYSVLFKEFCGIEYSIIYKDIDNTRLTLDGKSFINLPDILFSIKEASWLTHDSLPKQPLKSLQISESFLYDFSPFKELPIIYGETKNINFEILDSNLYFPVDIFGSSFFMLSRFEEIVKKDRDEHGRFLAVDSLAYQEHFLNRPIINEYLNLLVLCIKKIWPSFKIKERSFNIRVSHDVDKPFLYSSTSLYQISRECLSLVVKQKKATEALSVFSDWFCVKNGIKPDPYDTFDRIMDISEQKGLKSCFYFITDSKTGLVDCSYRMSDPLITALLKKIHKRGHEIGLHGSYVSYNDKSQLSEEFYTLKTVCSANNIKQDTWGGRQHYLRWENPSTWQNWADAGLDYDTTLAYVDIPGFRCGVCYQYPVYNVVTKTRLNLYEYPLIVMECSVIDHKYMGLDFSEASFNYIKGLKDVTRFFNGSFSLLWHNSYFNKAEAFRFYEAIL